MFCGDFVRLLVVLFLVFVLGLLLVCKIMRKMDIYVIAERGMGRRVWNSMLSYVIQILWFITQI